MKLTLSAPDAVQLQKLLGRHEAMIAALLSNDYGGDLYVLLWYDLELASDLPITETITVNVPEPIVPAIRQTIERQGSGIATHEWEA